MGIFGHPSGDKIMAKGERTIGTIVGLDISYSSDEGSTERTDEYSVRLATGAVIGIRQRLWPSEYVRLGMSVNVLVLNDWGVIDWTATGARSGFAGQQTTAGHKVRKTSPPPGIVDQYLSRFAKKASAATIEITSLESRKKLMGMVNTVTATATVTLPDMDPYEAEIGNFQAPFYASHMGSVGEVLPGLVKLRRLDRPEIDWPAAAVANPGIDSPPIHPPISTVYEPSELARSAPANEQEVLAQVAEAGSNGQLFGGIDLATLVGIEAGLIRDRVPSSDHEEYAAARGVAPGTWAATSAEWKQAYLSDWKLGAAYGEAIQAAMKRR